jgi:hypothetical protein
MLHQHPPQHCRRSYSLPILAPPPRIRFRSTKPCLARSYMLWCGLDLTWLRDAASLGHKTVTHQLPMKMVSDVSTATSRALSMWVLSTPTQPHSPHSTCWDLLAMRTHPMLITKIVSPPLATCSKLLAALSRGEAASSQSLQPPPLRLNMWDIPLLRKKLSGYVQFYLSSCS